MTSAEDKEIILYSDYNPGEVKFTHKSICEALLEKASENIEGGRLKWLTNSITGETVTFADVEPMSRKVASFFVKHGMTQGDKCIQMSTDITRIFTIMIGVWRAGGVVCSSYPEDTQETLADRVKDYKAKWIFCDPINVPQCQYAAKAAGWPVDIIVFGEPDECIHVDELFNDDGKRCPEKVTTGLDDPVLILCTSGTTGKSKGAVYSNRTILNFCLASDGIPRHNPGPSLWLIRSTHNLGILYPMRNIFVGDYSIMMTTVNKENIFKAVDKYHPFIVFGFPLYLLTLVNDPAAEKIDRSSIKVVCSGGIVLKESFYEAMMRLPNIKYVMNGFGLTECSAITTTVDIGGSSAGDFRSIPGIPPLTVGKLYPNTMLKVLDLDTGKSLGPNKEGELCVSSPVLCEGYFNRPEANASDFKTDKHGRWMKTGDLGYYDEKGFVFVLDRIKETFKYFNNHISPAELEEFLLLHPSVAEACVFGIQDPDGGDHIPRAIVTIKTGCKGDSKEILEFANSKVAPYKRIRGGVYIVEALPRGKTGKVVRSEAAKLAF